MTSPLQVSFVNCAEDGINCARDGINCARDGINCARDGIDMGEITFWSTFVVHLRTE